MLARARGGRRLDPAYAVSAAAVIVVGLGECCHTTVLMPLVAELAPVSLRGRYMAAMGFSWWIGLAIAPALGHPAAQRVTGGDVPVRRGCRGCGCRHGTDAGTEVA